MMMITLDAHSRDVVERMVRKGCTEVTDFMWQMQIKQRYKTTTANGGPALDKCGMQAQCDILNARLVAGEYAAATSIDFLLLLMSAARV